MAWVRIDDQLSDHPKIVAAGPDAAWLFIAGLCYAARYLTDGFIPDAQVRRLSDVKSPTSAAERLVSNGLWDAVEGGYVIHDYLDYNAASETVKERRQRNAERQSRWRDKPKHNGVSNASTEDVSNAPRNGVTNAPTNGPVTMPQTHTPLVSANALTQNEENPVDPEESPPRRKRPPDPLFEAVCEQTGLDWRALNDIERKRVNTACRLIRQSEGSPEDVVRAARQYRSRWPEIDLTAMGLASNWQSLTTGAGAPRVLTAEEMYGAPR